MSVKRGREEGRKRRGERRYKVPFILLFQPHYTYTYLKDSLIFDSFFWGSEDFFFWLLIRGRRKVSNSRAVQDPPPLVDTDTRPRRPSVVKCKNDANECASSPLPARNVRGRAHSRRRNFFPHQRNRNATRGIIVGGRCAGATRHAACQRRRSKGKTPTSRIEHTKKQTPLTSSALRHVWILREPSSCETRSIYQKICCDPHTQGAVLLLRRALELRTPGNVADLARTKRTLANVLAGFGDGFAMQMPEEFESLVHTREANAMDPPLGRSDAAAEEAGAWPPSPAERSWHAKFEHSGRSEGGVAPGREVRAGTSGKDLYSCLHRVTDDLPW